MIILLLSGLTLGVLVVSAEYLVIDSGVVMCVRVVFTLLQRRK